MGIGESRQFSVAMGQRSCRNADWQFCAWMLKLGVKLTASGSIDMLAKVAEAKCLNQVSSSAMRTVYSDGRYTCSTFRKQLAKILQNVLSAFDLESGALEPEWITRHGVRDSSAAKPADHAKHGIRIPQRTNRRIVRVCGNSYFGHR